MKLVCPVGSSNRASLGHAELVVHLVGRPKVDEGGASAEPSPIAELWLHIGLMYFSPYEPTFWVVEVVDNPGETVADDRRVYIKGTDTFSTLYEVFEPMRNKERITMRWYKLEQTPRVIPAFTPEVVPILELDGYGEAKEWFPIYRRKQRVGPTAAEDGSAAAGDVLGEAGGEAEPGEGGTLPEADEAGEAPLECIELLDPLMDAYETPVAIPDPAPAPVPEAGATDDADLAEPPPLPPPLDFPPPPPHAPTKPARAKTQEARRHFHSASGYGRHCLLP